jgi:RNA polymerase sigma factor (sigma-70 family)
MTSPDSDHSPDKMAPDKMAPDKIAADQISHGELAEALAVHYRELLNFTRAKTGDASLAEDLVQETCLRAAHGTTADIRNLRAFLFRVAGNLVSDHFRRLRRTRERFSQQEAPDVAEDRQSAEEQLIARQRLQILQEAIDELPPRARECFILRRFDNLSHAEIAEHMKITRSAVEKHLAAATLHCTKRIRERG